MGYPFAYSGLTSGIRFVYAISVNVEVLRAYHAALFISIEQECKLQLAAN